MKGKLREIWGRSGEKGQNFLKWSMVFVMGWSTVISSTTTVTTTHGDQKISNIRRTLKEHQNVEKWGNFGGKNER